MLYAAHVFLKRSWFFGAGLLKTLGANKDAPLPVRLFEVSDVVLLTPEAEVGARNERRLAAAVCGPAATFEVAHGVLNRLMEALGVPLLGAPSDILLIS